jgi:two-component system cell cycle sensor histidine kinase/response regulator CckA
MADEAAAAAVPDSPRTSRRQVVLVVDDEEGLRELLCRGLQDEGYHVLTAGNGVEALEIMETAPPVDLVVTDVVMPGMDGRELGRRLAQRSPDLPVLYISAYDVNDIFRRGSPRSSAPFLQKPFPLEGLLTVARDLIANRSPR